MQGSYHCDVDLSFDRLGQILDKEINKEYVKKNFVVQNQNHVVKNAMKFFVLVIFIIYNNLNYITGKSLNWN